ncbi:MAG: hypothetical protein M3552_00680 [Planctomycetota bacterium]|nr:hypothetical protein [Planctomycetaceae bacterium]MDQ3329160.1 hypothetical protein [Planctomycetota bacterium]
MTIRPLAERLVIATEVCLAGLVAAGALSVLLWRLGDPTGTLWATRAGVFFVAATIAVTATICLAQRLQNE